MAPPKKARTEPWPQNPMQSINNHKFLNAPSDAVVEMLRGFVQSHPNVQLLDGLPDIKVVVRCNTLLSNVCLLYTSPSPRDLSTSRMPSSA